MIDGFPKSGPWIKRVDIGDAILILGDCKKVLPHIPSVDACVTDPPYGIKRDTGMGGKGKAGICPRNPRQYAGGWDSERKCDELLLALGLADSAVVWGGNYYTDILSQQAKWLVWDKEQTMPSYSDAELAWTTLSGVAVKMKRYSGNGLMALEKDRVHPTQKPVALMEWCIQLLPSSRMILDCFMGSGTTGVACANLGRKFIGIEIEERYFDIACERIAAAYAQGRLFA